MENDLLRAMLAIQRGLQSELYGYDIFDLTDSDLGVFYIRDMVVAATSELHEVLEETSWKPVPYLLESLRMDRAGVKRELVDVWMFLMNMILASGMTADELFVEFMRKQAEVRVRHGLNDSR